jgi:antitoxin VapB
MIAMVTPEQTQIGDSPRGTLSGTKLSGGPGGVSSPDLCTRGAQTSDCLCGLSAGRAPSLCNPVAQRRPTESKSVKCCCTKNCVYTCCIYIVGGWCLSTARVFRSGNSQAVRLPKQFRLKSEEVEIFRRGDEIVLREKDGTMARAFDLLAGLPDDLVERVTRP